MRPNILSRVFALDGGSPFVRDVPCHVLTADCPWPFNDKLPGPGRGAEKHYNVMSIDDLCNFALPPIADDCHLFMWRVSSMVEEAYKVVRAWGFIPKSEIIWRKTTVNGKRHFGMGRHVRLEHEAAIIAVRGKPKVRDASIRSVFDAVATRQHSAKPEAFYDMIEKLCVGPYTELFGRRKREGWLVLGNEAPK